MSIEIRNNGKANRTLAPARPTAAPPSPRKNEKSKGKGKSATPTPNERKNKTTGVSVLVQTAVFAIFMDLRLVETGTGRASPRRNPRKWQRETKFKVQENHSTREV